MVPGAANAQVPWSLTWHEGPATETVPILTSAPSR